MAENVIELTNENFDSEVVAHQGTVLVDFWAPWCGPCRMVGPVVEQIATEYAGRAKVAKLNTDEASDIASRYGIRSIPTLLFFKNGEVVQQLVGAYPKPKITEKLDAAL
ncbi:MAG TPA: thioredoxin [Fibrobacteria bacterium]|jgi:thioredoxin 1|nr:thioredoxin [Fibrobacteria bacterium]